MEHTEEEINALREKAKALLASLPEDQRKELLQSVINRG